MAKSSWGLETAFGSRRVWSGLIGDRGCAARPSSSVQNPILPVRRGARLVLCRADPVHRLAGASDSSCSLARPPMGVVAQAKAEQGVTHKHRHPSEKNLKKKIRKSRRFNGADQPGMAELLAAKTALRRAEFSYRQAWRGRASPTIFTRSDPSGGHHYERSSE